MKIFICCSKHFYHKVDPIKKALEEMGHEITVPNSFDAPFKEEEMKKSGKDLHAKWKSEMIKKQETKIKINDAILVLNFDKPGEPNYIGGATFLEMYKSWELGKKIFLYHQIPKSILKDEILAFEPEIINEDLSIIK